MKVVNVLNRLPNILSLSRNGFGPVSMVLAVNGMWFAACVVALVGAVTDLLDGYFARLYHVADGIGRDVIQPLSTLIFTATIMIGLMWSGEWSWWIGAGCLAVSGVFQLISIFADKSVLMTRLKRHQYYLHPFFSMLIMIAALYWYIVKATESYDPSVTTMALVAFYGAIIGIIYSRREWLADLIKGPELTK